MIRIELIEFDAERDSQVLDGEDEFNYTQGNTALFKLFKTVVGKINKIDHFSHWQHKMPQEWIEDDIPSTPIDEGLAFKIIAIDNKSLFEWAMLADPCAETLGFADVNGGFISEDMSDEFRAVMLIDETDFITKFNRHMDAFKDDANPDCISKEMIMGEIEDYLDAYVTTITHEIYHLKEFAEATNGLTPYEFQNESEYGAVNVTLNEAMMGLDIYIKFEDYDSSNPEFASYMHVLCEERVEKKGRHLTSMLNLRSDAYPELIKAYDLDRRALGFFGMESDRTNEDMEMKAVMPVDQSMLK